MEAASLIFDKTQVFVVGWVVGVVFSGAIYFLSLTVSFGTLPMRYITRESEKGS